MWEDIDICNDYEYKSSDDCDHHKKMVENDWIYKFIVGLNIEFDEGAGSLVVVIFLHLERYFLKLKWRKVVIVLCLGKIR